MRKSKLRGVIIEKTDWRRLVDSWWSPRRPESSAKKREIQIARLYGEVITVSVVSGPCVCDVV